MVTLRTDVLWLRSSASFAFVWVQPNQKDQERSRRDLEVP